MGIKPESITINGTTVPVVSVATEPRAKEQSGETQAPVGLVEATSLHKLRCHPR